METALLGLGSNLGERLQLLQQARLGIDEHPGISLQGASPVFETAPVGGPADQPPFLNAAIEVGTTLPPEELLAWSRTVEERCGRIRGERWGPRLIDIDILFYGNLIIRQPELTIPHPRLHERRFVLVPLNELAPDFIHSVFGRTCRELLENLPSRSGGETLYTKDW
ncbi:MAG: 2-amino-4-hydroxy-6-hydroxymethyldihydropteridine diphosphokinase [Desulfuromonadales bacterium]